MKFKAIPANGESEAHSACFFVSRHSQDEESVEELQGFRFCERGAKAVFYREFFIERDVNGVIRCVFEGVVDEVVQECFYLFFVCLDVFFFSCKLYGDPFFSCDGLQRVDGFRYQAVQIEI